MLAAAISSGLDLVEYAVTRTTDDSLEGLVSAVAEAGLERPDLWTLLQSDSRFLDSESAAKVAQCQRPWNSPRWWPDRSPLMAK
ncbi:hypothetical protein SAMN06265360_1352 [Haloechinothrix alba]|uniref:Uncharacterized protein n=1 Tax=Haloechinothrix alba TaxID=664784 RepID=A0A239ABF6_9PSEU|nr:hypothetical protein SAMN06265360_1352 [Haloechinothrix alba]